MTRSALLLASLVIAGCNGGDDTDTADTDSSTPVAEGCDSCAAGEVCVEYTEGGEQVDFSCEPLDPVCSDIADVCGVSGEPCYDVYSAFCEETDGRLCFTVGDSATFTCSG